MAQILENSDDKRMICGQHANGIVENFALTPFLYLRPWLLMGTLILCGATRGFKVLGSLPPAEDSRSERTSQALPSQSADQVALQQAELQLAQRFIDDFPGKADPLSIMANVLYRHGKANEALTFLQRAREISPKRADIYVRMAELSFKRGELEETISHYSRALDIQPRLPNAYSNMGNALMMLGRYDEAITALQREIQISPAGSFAFFLLGQTYAQQRDYARARENYKRAIEIKPDYANAYYGLVTVCTRLEQAEQAQAYLETFRQLKAAERKGQKGRKIQYDDFTETQKNAAITYISIGGIYRKVGKLDQAETILKRAAGLDPRNVVCFLELASLFQKQGRIPQALAMHKQVTEIKPDYPVSYLMIGILSAHLQQYDAAEKALQKMITLAPAKSDGYRELARLYLKRGKNTAQAKQLAQRAVALAPIATNHFVLGWAHHASGDPAQAQALVERALEQDPDNLSYQRLYKLVLQGN